tara:strand:- start:1607 stop:2878 length:1272 start_codon:yes stop_codon:yes gene_type:complete
MVTDFFMNFRDMKTPHSGPSGQDLLTILDQAAIGLIVADKPGNILHMNQMAEQMVLPLFQQAGQAPTNILNLLEMIAPGIAEKVENFPDPTGFVITQQKQTVEMEYKGEKIIRHFFYSINKVSEESIVYSFDDITNYHTAQEELADLNQKMAIDRSKFEMAAGVLHDIGNAVVGIGSHLTKARRSLENSDLETLKKLLQFFEVKRADLTDALGESKFQALVNLVTGLEENQRKLEEELNQNLKEQMGITSHISDILNIQRQYVYQNGDTKRDPVHIKSVLYDALSILMASIEKRRIKLEANIPEDCSKFTGDRTKLIQVFINLIKNALDAIDDAGGEDHRLSIDLKEIGDHLEVTIQDSGIGFEPNQTDKLFERGFTTKTQGSGIGMATSRAIIESHSGTLSILSDGPGKGATVQVTIPLQQD